MLPDWWPSDKPYIIGDCLSEDGFSMKDIPDDSVDLIVTDPPYGITKNEWDNAPDWGALATLFKRILVWNGQIAIFGKQPMLTDIMNGFKTHFDFRFETIWYKKAGMWSSNYIPIPVHENILVFKQKKCKVSDITWNIKEIQTKGKPYFKGRMSDSPNQGEFKKHFKTRNKGVRHPKTVLTHPACSAINPEYIGFPTQKPVKLIIWFIKAMSGEGAIVFRPIFRQRYNTQGLPGNQPCWYRF